MQSYDPFVRQVPLAMETPAGRRGPIEPGAPELEGPDQSTAELLKVAMSEARQLIQLEVALAKDEMKRDVVAARSAGIALGVCGSLLLVGLTLLLVALSLAIFPGPVPALMIGIAVLVVAAIAGVAGYTLLPKKPLYETRFRIENNIDTVRDSVKERAA